jgi:hypothetical protein
VTEYSESAVTDGPAVPAGLILFVLHPEYGANNASFRLARLLTERGHRVLYLASPKIAEHIRRQGFTCECLCLWWQHDSDARERRRELTKGKTGLRKFTVAARHDLSYHHSAMDQLRGWLKGQKLSVAVIDPLIWGVCGPLVEEGVSLIAFSNTMASTIELTAPPVSEPIQPVSPRMPIEKLQSALAWLRPFLVTARTMRRALAHAIVAPRPWHADYNTVALIRRHGLRFGVSEYGPRLRLPELVAAPEALEFPFSGNLKKRIYLGDCVEMSRSDGGFDWTGIDLTKPLVYCSLGSYSEWYAHSGRLFTSVIEAFRDRPEWQVLLQVGHANLASYAAVPPNVRVAAWVPQLEVLSKSRVFITHGGLGSLREAFHFAVPMILCPCNVDQPGNAARAAFHGIGIVGDVANMNATTMRALFERLMAMDSASNYQRLHQRERNRDGYAEAADLIVSRATR